jgi:hypothetical protein
METWRDMACVFIKGIADPNWFGVVCPAEGGRLEGRLDGWLPGTKEGSSGEVVPRLTDGGVFPGEEGRLCLVTAYVSCKNGGRVGPLSVMPRDRVGGRELGWL